MKRRSSASTTGSSIGCGLTRASVTASAETEAQGLGFPKGAARAEAETRADTRETVASQEAQNLLAGDGSLMTVETWFRNANTLIGRNRSSSRPHSAILLSIMSRRGVSQKSPSVILRTRPRRSSTHTIHETEQCSALPSAPSIWSRGSKSVYLREPLDDLLRKDAVLRRVK